MQSFTSPAICFLAGLETGESAFLLSTKRRGVEIKGWTTEEPRKGSRRVAKIAAGPRRSTY